MFHITMEEAYVDRGNAPLYSGQTFMPPLHLGHPRVSLRRGHHGQGSPVAAAYKRIDHGTCTWFIFHSCFCLMFTNCLVNEEAGRELFANSRMPACPRRW
jgi:hypothetical protein